MLSFCFLLSIAFCPPSYSSYLQLDANLVEEPNNRFTQKINTTKSGATNFKYLEIVVNLSKRMASVWGPLGPSPVLSNTDLFYTHPVGQKTSLVNFKHYTDGIGTGYMSHDKEI